jgi:hypothetical protein
MGLGCMGCKGCREVGRNNWVYIGVDVNQWAFSTYTDNLPD